MHFIQDFVTYCLDFIESHQHLSAFVIFFMAFSESLAIVSLIVPAMAILFGCGALIGMGTLSFFPVWIAASVGAVLGDSISYWLGFHYNESILSTWPMKKHPQLYKKGEVFFEKYGVWSIFLGRFFGPLRAVVPLIAGAVKMNRATFNVSNVLSAPLWVFIVLAPGMFGLQWIESIIG